MSVNLRHPCRGNSLRAAIHRPLCYARRMALSDRQLLHFLSWMPFIDSAELSGILGEAHSAVHRTLAALDRRHRLEGESRDHLPAIKPEILPDDHWHQTGRPGPRLRDALGPRAGLTHVQGVAGAAHPLDGRGGLRLSTRRVTVSRHLRAPVARGVPPQGTLRRHDDPPRRPQLLGCSPSRSPLSHSAQASYLYRKPSVSTRLSQRSLLAFANAAASVSFRHLAKSIVRFPAHVEIR